MKKSRWLFVLVLFLVGLMGFLVGRQFNSVTKAQGRQLQTYRVIRLDAAVSQLMLSDQMNQYADIGYRYRDMRDGYVIMEYVGK